jgi:hypothetical protein
MLLAQPIVANGGQTRLLFGLQNAKKFIGFQSFEIASIDIRFRQNPEVPVSLRGVERRGDQQIFQQ